jgi:hypothetical protein
MIELQTQEEKPLFQGFVNWQETTSHAEAVKCGRVKLFR